MDDSLETNGQDERDNPDRETEELEGLCRLWNSLAAPHEMSSSHMAQLHRYLIRYDLAMVRLALAHAVDYYLFACEQTVEITVQKIGGILFNNQLKTENPELALFRKIYYIVRKRLNVPAVDEVYEEPGDAECDEAMELLELAHRRGVPLEELEIAARASKTMEQFNAAVIEHVRRVTDKSSKPDVVIQVNVVPQSAQAEL